MTQFIEIKTIHDRSILLNIEQIQVVSEGIQADYNFIEMINGLVFKTYESIDEIKAKLK